MTFSFHPATAEEFQEAVAYYENAEPGLGSDFSREVLLTIQRTVSFPEAWAVLEGDIRRSLVKRFPYGILYSQEPDGLLIIAVMHVHRRPGYWRKR